MSTADRNLIAHLVSTMRSVKSALSSAGHLQIRVYTTHSLGILSASEPPSSGRFRRSYDKAIFTPMLRFHQRYSEASSNRVRIRRGVCESMLRSPCRSLWSIPGPKDTILMFDWDEFDVEMVAVNGLFSLLI
ncbi:uncharacterized protein A4U43_C04F24740 [Asparagus officinalis]|uniref:Uncharacterized protein n=1 Tax=Asparagus officinalis TaxID=4686 RepID=A0A5P1F3H0_ASPOF|nr:uncharacterized protein A4U43_C04F24740 [Asparagus officinalis]